MKIKLLGFNDIEKDKIETIEEIINKDKSILNFSNINLDNHIYNS